MRRVNPTTMEMEIALSDHTRGGPAIVKGDLYLHAKREALARAQGWKSWDEKQAHQDAETREFWGVLMCGAGECGSGKP